MPPLTFVYSVAGFRALIGVVDESTLMTLPDSFMALLLIYYVFLKVIYIPLSVICLSYLALTPSRRKEIISWPAGINILFNVAILLS